MHSRASRDAARASSISRPEKTYPQAIDSLAPTARQDPPRRALIAGATGFIGGRLATALATAGWNVRCLVRNPSRATHLQQRGYEMHEGDVLREESLRGAGEQIDVAYYLVHSMGRGSEGAFADRERAGARAFAEMARAEGIQRVIYLGGLGDQPQSEHLRSRHATAEVLREHGPPLTYFRAGMVVGPESESYRTLRYLVQRLPAMIAPAWLKTSTQPIAIDDVLEYLVQAPSIDAAAGREVQIGGPDVLSYGDMLDRMAEALGRRAREASAAEDPVPVRHAVAVVAVDRARHARRRRRGAPADRGARHSDDGHGSIGRVAVRRPADPLWRSAQASGKPGS